MSSATAGIAPDLLKALAILPSHNCEKLCNRPRRPKPYWKSEKKVPFLQVINGLIIQKFFKDFNNHKKILTGQQCLAVDLSQILLNTATTNETFQQSGKEDSFRHILKSSAGMYESSGSQFFRTITGKESRPDNFDESWLVMTF